MNCLPIDEILDLAERMVDQAFSYNQTRRPIHLQDMEVAHCQLKKICQQWRGEGGDG